jgi:hypothetical protein
MVNLNEKIQDRIFLFTEILNDTAAKRDNTNALKTIKVIDKLVSELYKDLYGLIENKKISAISDNKCGHCG